MHDNNKSGVDLVRETFEKHLQGVDATGGRPDANRWEAGRLVARSSLVFGRTDPMIVIAHRWSARLLGRKAALRGSR
jgi:hypothetical protein